MLHHLTKTYALNHAPIPFHFSQNARDFIVREVPLYPFSNNGEHLILKIRKKGLSTQEMLKILSSYTGNKIFGYAGLKDKSATTTQYISLHKNFSTQIQNSLPQLEERGIKILEQTFHCNKIRIGHLKGNDFFIRLKKVTPVAAMQIKEAIEKIKFQGLPNYFGYQRFGKNFNNHFDGEKILKKEIKIRNKITQNFLISSYQSHLFNLWLDYRIKLCKIFENFTPQEIYQALKMQNLHLDISHIKELLQQDHFYKIFRGDVLSHYPTGKVFCTQNDPYDLGRFQERSLSPTGPIFGKKLFESQDFSKTIESKFCPNHLAIQPNGTRRYAWIWAENISYTYIEDKAQFELEFFLPKGSYATIFLEEIAHRLLQID